MRLVLTPGNCRTQSSYNVIGDLKGSENPEQVVIVSGHLDSWDLGTGAIDDGAGVAVAMQAANLVKQLGLKPRRTIRVIAWMNEENGLRGGTTYAAEHAAEVANHFGAIETDGGADHPIGIYFGPRREMKAFLQPVAQVLTASGAGNIEARDHIGADIDPLFKLGVPISARFRTAASILTTITRRRTRSTRSIRINWPKMRRSMLSSLHALANLQQPLPR